MDHILESRDYFLNALNVSAGTLEFLQTDIATLQNAAFLDGRTEVSIDGRTYSVALDDAFAWYESHGVARNTSRLIFHISFCGSTLLCRALETDDSVLVYKEPQVLTDLDEMNRRKEFGNVSQYDRKRILGVVLSQFNSTDQSTWITAIKPANLMNAMISDICELNDSNKAVFLDMNPQSFLIAVLRGGSPRISFIFRVIENIRGSAEGYDDVINRLPSGTTDELAIVARKILLAHAMQSHIFADTMASMPKDRYVHLSYEQLLASPHEQVGHVATLFDMPLSADQVSRNIDSSFGRHSKAEGLAFDPRSAAELDAQVIDMYSSAIENAMDWYEQLELSK